jgi:hypothetical protein
MISGNASIAKQTSEREIVIVTGFSFENLLISHLIAGIKPDGPKIDQIQQWSSPVFIMQQHSVLQPCLLSIDSYLSLKLLIILNQ